MTGKLKCSVKKIFFTNRKENEYKVMENHSSVATFVLLFDYNFPNLGQSFLELFFRENLQANIEQILFNGKL